MEFIPFEFIDQVLFQHFYDTSPFQNLSTSWGEKAKTLLKSYFPVDLHISCSLDNDKTGYKSNLFIDPESQVFWISGKAYFLEKIVITNYCSSFNAPVSSSKTIINALRSYLTSTPIFPKELFIIFGDCPEVNMVELLSFLENDI
ncbi:hypothetical protein L596_025516 [Steinernema carpocapsae]|uniref:Uncharacterized protein n=1 Tax=Steinernema carpocapsae TaxID=34508 RepID=A0A4U5M8T4_STECR|nr:hypothetical protein L596_025516 [Steinernema carpocapsae]